MKKFKKGLWLPLISLCVTAASVSAQPLKSDLPASTAVNFPTPAAAVEENYLNTVTTTGPDGTRYKLVQIGDRLPKLFVNNKLIATENLDRYAGLIESLTPILWQRQKETAWRKDVDEITQQEAIINDMVKDQLIKTPKDVVSFRLTANEMIVNGKAQSFPVFSRYMKKYIKNGDRAYQFNYSSK